MKFNPKLLILVSLFCLQAFGDTPPPGTVKLKGGTDATTIGNISDSLKVDVTNAISATISGTVPVSQSGVWDVSVNNFPATYAVTQSTTPWVVNGSGFTQPISGSVSVSNFPATQPVSGTVTANQGTGGASAWKVDGSAVTQPVSGTVSVSSLPAITGTVTANAGTGTFTVGQTSGSNLHANIDNFPVTQAVTQSTSPWVVSGTVAATQSGSWSTGRTWTLLNSTDSVNAVQSGTWTVQQGTPPWSVSQSGTWTNTVTQATGTNLHVVVDSAPSTSVTQGTSPWVVSGTVTANAGTNLNTSALALDTTVSGLQVSQGSTTSGEKGTLTLGAVTTAAPSYTTAQSSPLSLNTSGGLRVDGSGVTQPVSGTVSATQGTSPWVSNISQFGGSSVVTGTGASGSGIPRVTVANDSNILATQSGSWTVTANAGTNLNTSALATSANQTTVGSQTTKINDGTNTAAVKAASTAPVAADPALVVAISPNSPQAVAQGSTTSGQIGPLVQGSVTTNSPTYTTAQTSPLSLTTRGALRQVQVGGDTSQLIRNDYSSTNVTTAAYVQLVASTSLNINRLWVFDSSGQDLVLAVGAAASEVDQIQIPPGGWDAPVDIFIPSGSRISVKARSATASSGVLLITGIK